MTENTNIIRVEQALKSKKNFEDFITQTNPREINAVVLDYLQEGEQKDIVRIVELTQNYDSLFKELAQEKVKALKKTPYVIWVVNSYKEDILATLKMINKHSKEGFGIFVFKADLNDNKMTYECILKPGLKEKGTNTFNLEYWRTYKKLNNDRNNGMNISINDRQFKTISINKTGVSVMQTISNNRGQISSELYINDNKELFDNLLTHKAEIEAELGELNWLRLENKKASRIVKVVSASFEDSELETTIKEHITLAENFKKVFYKYL